MTDSPDGPPGGSDRSSDGHGTDDSSAPIEKPGGVDPDDEVVDEAGEESFPASDSPSTWAGPPPESR